MNKLLTFLISALLMGTAMASERQIPKNRQGLQNGDWFPYVISKIAPLEWWDFTASAADLKRENYQSDWSYGIAKQNTWEFPRFCFSMFRPSPESYASLYAAVEEYKGDVVWQMHDYCIGASPIRGTFYSGGISRKKLEDAFRNLPKADPEFVKRALADVPNFCQYLETKLGLKDKSHDEFDPHWLTRDGLASSRGQFEDFVEPGSWTVMLSRDPEKFATSFQSTSEVDRSLSFGLGMFEGDAIFEELGANWKKHQAEGDNTPMLPDYPLLSRLDDITSDATFQPNEVDRLLAECLKAQASVKNPSAIRGLDKLIRIARWAASFGGCPLIAISMKTPPELCQRSASSPMYRIAVGKSASRKLSSGNNLTESLFPPTIVELSLDSA